MNGVNYRVSTHFFTDEREDKVRMFETISEALIFLNSEGFNQLETFASSGGSGVYFVHTDSNDHSANLFETTLPIDYVLEEERT